MTELISLDAPVHAESVTTSCPTEDGGAVIGVRGRDGLFAVFVSAWAPDSPQVYCARQIAGDASVHMNVASGLSGDVVVEAAGLLRSFRADGTQRAETGLDFPAQWIGNVGGRLAVLGQHGSNPTVPFSPDGRVELWTLDTELRLIDRIELPTPGYIVPPVDGVIGRYVADHAFSAAGVELWELGGGSRWRSKGTSAQLAACDGGLVVVAGGRSDNQTYVTMLERDRLVPRWSRSVDEEWNSAHWPALSHVVALPGAVAVTNNFGEVVVLDTENGSVIGRTDPAESTGALIARENEVVRVVNITDATSLTSRIEVFSLDGTLNGSRRTGYLRTEQRSVAADERVFAVEADQLVEILL